MNKTLLRGMSTAALLTGIGLALYIWLGEAFTYPLGLCVLSLMLVSLWLQSESK